MSDHDPALIEKAAKAIYDNAAEPTGVKARAVLDAVADDLRAEAWEEAAESISDWMWNNPSPSGIPLDPPRNPYRKEADHG